MSLASLNPESREAVCKPRRSFPFALTTRGMLLVGAGLFLLVPAFLWEKLLWILLAGELVVLLACFLDALRLPAPAKILAGRQWRTSPSLGSTVEVELHVLHHGSQPLLFHLLDDLPPAVVALPASHRLEAFPNAGAVLRYSFKPMERGDFTTGDLYLRYSTGLGLVERWAVAPLAQPLRIYPALRTGEEQNIFLARSHQIDMQLRHRRHRGLGRDFESLREYRPGDDLRDICWTATARRGSFITRQYQTERSQAVWIVLDAGRLLRARLNGISKLDHACATAVALAQLALFSGDRVGLLAYGAGIQQRLLPGRGAEHMRHLLDSLAQIRSESGEADHLLATATLSRLQPRRSLILWITDLAETAMRPEVIDGAMQLLRRHVLLFVAIAQPDVEAIADRRPENVEEMFRSAAALELASRRQRLLTQLRDHGALTLDLHPDALTSAVLNQYLEVKERAMVG